MPPMVKQSPYNENWRLLELSYTSVFQNLALEEALARNTSTATFRPTIRLWVDPPAVVVGRFQNVKTEVNMEFCKQNNVSIARRFTGGGAVFHDEGNLNLTIVRRRPEGIMLPEFHEANSSIVMDLLDNLGLEGTFIPPNSIHVSGKKVSGAAAALSRQFVFWHASILISTDTDMLNQVLLPNRQNHAAYFIRSRWQPVTTLEAALGKNLEIEDVKRQLVSSLESLLQVRLEANGLFDDEEQHMVSLHAGKYSSDEWNLYGHWSQEAV